MAPTDDAASRFVIDLTRPLPRLGEAAPAFQATDRRMPGVLLMAEQVRRDAPARAATIAALSEPIENLLTPAGWIRAPTPSGEAGLFVLSGAPPGPAVGAALRAWGEEELIAQVLLPTAQTLVALAARGQTHRALHLGNVFDCGPTRAVTLGPAWAAPPAMYQPPLFDPPYSAICHPAGRGDGSIADDVYALGVLLVCLALGRVPLADQPDTMVVRRKLAMGSYPALVGDARLPPAIADLARNMLAEDPEHRPPPHLLLDPGSARGRRVAARPPRRAQRALEIGTAQVWDSRSLAHAIAVDPAAGLTAMRTGEVPLWLRRGLGDAALAVKIEELERHRIADGRADDARADAAMVMRAVVLIDPLAPLCWRGVNLWPDALGPLLAAGQHAEPPLQAAMEELVLTEGISSWAMLRTERCDFTALRLEGRQQRGWLQLKGPSGGGARLLYGTNPLLPCASPLLDGHWVGQLADLLPALEARAARAEAELDPVDHHMVAFVAARSERRLDMEVNGLNGRMDDATRVLAELRLLAALQQRYAPRPVPALAAWVAARGLPLVAVWRNRQKRERVASELNTLAAAGMLAPVLALVDDPTERSNDAHGAIRAAEELTRIDAELALIEQGGPTRAGYAARIGSEMAAAAGLTVLAAMLGLAAMG